MLFTEVANAANHHILRLVALADHQITILWFDSADDGRLGYPGRAVSQAILTRKHEVVSWLPFCFLLSMSHGTLACICLQPQALQLGCGFEPRLGQTLAGPTVLAWHYPGVTHDNVLMCLLHSDALSRWCNARHEIQPKSLHVGVLRSLLW